MTLEIRVQGIHLFFLGYRGLEVPFDGAQRPLQVVVLLPELVEQTLLQRCSLLVSLAHCHLLLLHVFHYSGLVYYSKGKLLSDYISNSNF